MERIVNARYVATVNVPGYLPMDDDPPVFDTAREAWAYLADERDRAIDDVWQEGDPDTDDACVELLYLAETGPEPGVGTVYGSTPGYEGDHDLGLAYSVSEVES